MDRHDKSTLRQEIRRKRDGFPEQEWKAASRAICEKLFALPEFGRCWTLMSYVSFGREVGTLDLIRKGLSTAKTVCIPRTKLKEGVIEAVQIFEIDEIDFEGFVPQPMDGNIIPAGEIEMVIVPGIVFDESGNRIGSGKGFYDRFLPACQGLKAGLAFDFQVMAGEVPHVASDVAVDLIITETRIIRC